MTDYELAILAAHIYPHVTERPQGVSPKGIIVPEASRAGRAVSEAQAILDAIADADAYKARIREGSTVAPSPVVSGREGVSGCSPNAPAPSPSRCYLSASHCATCEPGTVSCGNGFNCDDGFVFCCNDHNDDTTHHPMPHTRAALIKYDAGEAARDAAWDAVAGPQADEHAVGALAKSDAAALEKVRRAFHADTDDVNTWSQAQAATLAFMRRMTARDDDANGAERTHQES